MEYAACVVPAAPVRKKASHDSEMINQLLFGETVKVLKAKKNEWVKIVSMHDKYEGWVRANQFEPVNEDLGCQFNEWVTGDWINPIILNDSVMKVPIGSSLLGYNEQDGRFGNFEYQFYENSYRRNDMIPQPSLIEQLVQPWLHAPYLWGGRTPMGVDCSGFTQVVYKMMGIDLWRDAFLQAEQGIKISNISEVQPGDLAFFNDKKDRITHVGIILNENRIIHSSGKVRIDLITDEGILNTDTTSITHKLKTIRRHW